MLAQVLYRPIAPEDIPLVSALHERVFGPGRFARTAYRVREEMASGQEISRFCRLAASGDHLIAALRMSEVTIGGQSGAALLGPLVVAPEYMNRGYGRALVNEALDAARAAAMKVVILVGDESYYGRFGFKRVPPGQITLPGPVDPARLLAVELSEGALGEFSGLVSGR